MTEMNLSNNLQQLMRIHGNISVSDLARSTGIPQPTLHHILSGSTKRPRKQLLQAVANFFSVSIDQLNGEESLPNIIPNSIKEELMLKTVPIISWEMLKQWPLVNIKDRGLKEILLNTPITDHSFALIVQNSLLEPLFSENTLLIFDYSKQPKDRDLVIVNRGEDLDILFNRLFIDNNYKYIKQNLEDGNAKLVKLDKNIDRIVGTLIEARVQY